LEVKLVCAISSATGSYGPEAIRKKLLTHLLRFLRLVLGIQVKAREGGPRAL